MSQLYMKEDCDLLIRNGKLAITEDLNFEDLKCRLLQRVQSNLFDWIFKSDDYALVPAANLSQFLGFAINQEIIDAIKLNIFDAFTVDGLVDENKIYIREMALDKENIIFMVTMQVENRLQEFKLGMSIMYNTRQNVTSAKIEKISEEPWA